jgi:hypothetical protein
MIVSYSYQSIRTTKTPISTKNDGIGEHYRVKRRYVQLFFKRVKYSALRIYKEALGSGGN